MFDRLEGLAEEYAALERDLSDPAVHADPDRARTLGRRYGELGPIVHAYREWQEVRADEATAHELAGEDASFAAEAEQLGRRRAELEGRLEELLLPRDASDGRDVILEVKAGEGGEESALFAGDLLRMYLRYAERHHWKTEILDSTMTGLGGYKDVTVAIKAGRRPAAPGDGAWSRLKYEGGVHRVQRVPVTESQGRIHTSAAAAMSSRTGCRSCWCPGTRATGGTSSSRSRPARAARNRRCSPVTCCACTCASPSGTAGRPRYSTPP